MLKEKLKKAGLNESEIKAYLACLELGETNINRIAKKSGIKRTTTYLTIESLKEKGLIRSIKKKNKVFFYAEDPRMIKERMEENIKEVESAIPELLAMANLIDKKPNIKYFEGKEGIKDLFKDILKYPKSEVLEWYSESYATDFSEEFFSQYFTPRRIAKKIWVRAILPNNKIIKKLVTNNEKQLRQVKLIDQEKYKIKIEINLYGNNKTSIISFKEEFGLIIESQKIHESLKSMFELMWEYVPSKK